MIHCTDVDEIDVLKIGACMCFLLFSYLCEINMKIFCNVFLHIFFWSLSANKALMSKTAGSIIEAALKRDPNEVEFIQAVQEAVHALERVIAKNSQ